MPWRASCAGALGEEGQGLGRTHRLHVVILALAFARAAHRLFRRRLPSSLRSSVQATPAGARAGIAGGCGRLTSQSRYRFTPAPRGDPATTVERTPAAP